MTYLAVQYTATSSPPPEQGSGGLSLDLNNLTHSGGGLVILAVLGWAAYKLFSGPRDSTAALARAMRGGRGFWGALWGVVRAFWQVVVFILRFLAGRELSGKPKSDATFWRMGTPPPTPAEPLPPVAEFGSIALPAPTVSLVKTTPRAPRPWAVKAVRLITDYEGAGARALQVASLVIVQLGRAARWTWRLLCTIGRFFRSLHEAVAPVVTAVVRALAIWGRWPYAARSAARIGALALFVAWNVPALRGWAVLALVVLVGAFAAAVVTGPGLLGRWGVVPEPTDAERYAAALWLLLRKDLDLPEGEPMASWLHLPDVLAADDARIVISLPLEFRGALTEREALNELVNSRLPGEWVSTWDFKSERHTAVYTHKPPPKPKAVCPEGVGFFDEDIQAAIAECKKGEVVVGKDENGRVVVKELGNSETPHWALSVGTGGGKSAFCQMVIAQLIRQGYHIMVADVKRVSVDIYIGVPGVYVYNDPMNPQDMRAGIEWFKEEISARSALAEVDKSVEFPGFLCLIEEANEFADISREWWDENRKTSKDEEGPADRAADPIWGDVASGARLGRHVYGNIVAIFQDLRDQALGGKGLRNLFRLKFMGNFTVQQWKNVIGTTPVPESVDKAGRMIVVEGNAQYWVQTCYAEPEELKTWAIEQRQATGFDPAGGLFGTPPKPSPKRLPWLLERMSRDELPEALRGPSEGGLEDETAGRGVTLGGSVTPGVTPQRDRLRLIPGQAGAQGPEDPLAPPVLLTIAEIAHELTTRGYAIKANTISQHKRRRDTNGFPAGIIGEDGKERWTLPQLTAFYEGRGYEKTEPQDGATGQDDTSDAV